MTKINNDFTKSCYSDDSIISTVLIIESLAQPTSFEGRRAGTGQQNSTYNRDSTYNRNIRVCEF